jgi:hypothetical protein
MDTKVLASISWHYGTPDGDNEVCFLLDDFNIDNQDEAQQAATQLLLDFGVKEDDMISEGTCSYRAIIGNFEGKYPAGFKPFVKECNVDVTFEYVLSHHGRIFTLGKEIEKRIYESKRV